MKGEVVDKIICMLISNGVKIDGMQDRLYMILKDYEIKPMETAIALRNEVLNDQLVKRFLASKMVKGCTEKTISMYGMEVPRILLKIGKSVPDITSDDVRLYIAIRLQRDGISKCTADNEIRYLRSFFTFLQSEELIDKNPMLKVDKIRREKRKKSAFTEMECEMLRTACRTAREKAVVELLLSTGCRVSELVQMRMDEYEGDRIIVHGKGEKDRNVYLNAKAQIALEQYLSERKDTNPYFFPSGKFGGAHYKPSTAPLWYTNPDLIVDGHSGIAPIESMVRNLGKRAGVENAHPHRFRRTCATLALRRGMSLEQVSKMLGHENIATTQIYLDLSEDELRQAHAKYVV